jgi:ribonuclease D
MIAYHLREGESMESDYRHWYIKDASKLKQFLNDNTGMGWMAFDTEYTREEFFRPKLCLIQITTQRGNYIIDCLKVKDIRPLMDIIQNPDILKITHSGHDDYLIFKDKYDILPKNVFDTQIAAGFLGFKRKEGLGNLIKSELDIEVEKGLAASDWEKRPLTKAQNRYVLNDVIHLYPLMEHLTDNLRDINRIEWAAQEFKRLESPNYYSDDIIDSLLKISWVNNLTNKEKAYLIKLFEWRKKKAKKQNKPENRLLSLGPIYMILTLLPHGEHFLENHRRFPYKHLKGYIPQFIKIYKNLSDQNIKDIDKVPPNEYDAQDFYLFIDFLYLYISYRSLEVNIHPNMVCSKNELKRICWDNTFSESILSSGWRYEFIGQDLETLMDSDVNLIMDLGDSGKKFEISVLTDAPYKNEKTLEEVNIPITINDLSELGFNNDVLDKIPKNWVRATGFLLGQLPEDHDVKSLSSDKAGLWIKEEVRPILEKNNVEFRKLPGHVWELRKII